MAMTNKVVHEFVRWSGEECMDDELLLIDKYGDCTVIKDGKVIYHNEELNTKIYKILEEIRWSKILWKLPISIELGINLESHEIITIHIEYDSSSTN